MAVTTDFLTKPQAPGQTDTTDTSLVNAPKKQNINIGNLGNTGQATDTGGTMIPPGPPQALTTAQTNTTDPLAFTPPPAYTGPAAQKEMANSPFTPTQNMADYKVYDNLSGTYKNAQGQSYSGQSANVPAPTISSLTDAQKNLYWAGQGAINPDTLGLPKDATPDQIAAATKQYQTANQGQIGALTNQVHSGDAANLATQNAATQTFDDNQNKAAYGQLATALNGQPGYGGSGLSYLDPNHQGQTISNPTGGSYTPPDLGAIVKTGTQNAPTDQGGTVTNTTPPKINIGNTGNTGNTANTGNTNTNTGTQIGNTTTGNTALNQGAVQGSVQDATAKNGGVSLTQTDPNNPLTGQTIAPDNTVDRVKNFQDSLNSTISNVLDPAFQARERDLNRYNFGAGRGVSGEARTSQGTLASDYGNQIKDLTSQGLANASNGSIEDLYRNIDIAQQQQGFQAGQENNAFNQQAQLAQLQDALTNSAFGRSQAQEQAGYANDPSNIGVILSQIFGNQASQAGNAAAGLFQNAGKSSGSNGGLSTEDLIRLILQHGGGGGGGTGSTDSAGQPTE